MKWFMAYTDVRVHGGYRAINRGNTIVDKHPLIIAEQWRTIKKDPPLIVVDFYRELTDAEVQELEKAGIGTERDDYEHSAPLT